MIRKVKLVTITVLNPQRSLEFYRDKIGLKVLVDDRHDDGSRWIELVTPDGGTGIALVESQAGDRVGTFSNIILSCDNIYNTYSTTSAAAESTPCRPARRAVVGHIPRLQRPRRQLLRHRFLARKLAHQY